MNLFIEFKILIAIITISCSSLSFSYELNCETNLEEPYPTSYKISLSKQTIRQEYIKKPNQWNLPEPKIARYSNLQSDIIDSSITLITGGGPGAELSIYLCENPESEETECTSEQYSYGQKNPSYEYYKNSEKAYQFIAKLYVDGESIYSVFSTITMFCNYSR